MADRELQHELRDIKNTVEWELIRVNGLLEDGDDGPELRPGERRSLRAVQNHLSDAVLSLARMTGPRVAGRNSAARQPAGTPPAASGSGASRRHEPTA